MAYFVAQKAVVPAKDAKRICFTLGFQQRPIASHHG
jgi:hypothetical protein